MLSNRPSCAKHPNSTVWFDGTYGTPGHRRQRYKCRYAPGQTHVFTELLPRKHGGTGDCLDCERPYARHEGPPTPRTYAYSTRDISKALLSIGEGLSYRRAGVAIRSETRHFRPRGLNKERVSAEATLVQEWVEVFASAIYEQRRVVEAWPEIVLVDRLPMRWNTTNVKHGEKAFSVFGAYGYTKLNKPLGIVKFWASHEARRVDWAEFFSQLPGMPRRIVCDEEPGILTGASLHWAPTTPEIFLCHYHLRKNLTTRLEAVVPANHPILDQVEEGLGGVTRWARLEANLRALRAPSIDNWLDDPAPRICAGATRADQIAWQVNNNNGYAASTGALELVLNDLKGTFKRRTHVLRNQERTNRMLLLAELQHSKQADTAAYAKIIRDELAAAGGIAGQRKLIQIKDPAINGFDLRP